MLKQSGKILAITTLCAQLSACGTIFEGESQTVNISTQPTVAGTSCELRNRRGSWFTSPASNQVVVQRSRSDLQVSCAAPGYTGSAVAQSDAEAWTFGNILLGGVVGLAIDGMTGAMFSYDDGVTVPLTMAANYENAPQAPQPAPMVPETPQKQ